MMKLQALAAGQTDRIGNVNIDFLRHISKLATGCENEIGMPIRLETRRIPKHHDIFAEGDTLRDVMFLRDGWAYRYRLLGDGRRHIVNFLIPGDFVGPYFPTAAHFCGTLTDVTLCQAPRSDFSDANRNYPALASALEAIMATEYRLLSERLVSLGRRNARERMAHLLVELYERMRRVGLITDNSYEFPVTQEILADTLGLSVVHVNRTLRSLREDGFATVGFGRVCIRDLDGLRDVAGADEPTQAHWSLGTSAPVPFAAAS
ncbi:MAG: Crp/Fnr family transcriptional regulator [Rhodospirillales bacterium]|nr:Crp/Fnr family transcriptional regulator [Rhodospirillales bacterium]